MYDNERGEYKKSVDSIPHFLQDSIFFFFMDPRAVAALRADMFPVLLGIYGIGHGTSRAMELRALLDLDDDDDDGRNGGAEQGVLSLLPPPLLPPLLPPPPGSRALGTTSTTRRGRDLPTRRKTSTLARLPEELLMDIFSFEFIPRMWIYEWYLVNRRFYFRVAPLLGRYRQWLRGIHSIEHHMVSYSTPNSNGVQVSGTPQFLLLTPRNYNLSIAIMVCGGCGYSGPLEASGRHGTSQSMCIRCQDLRCCELQKLLWTADV